MQGQARDPNRSYKGVAAGLVAGLVASAVMNEFQRLWSRWLASDTERSHGAQSLQRGSPHTGISHYLEEHGGDDERDDATERIASAISQCMLHRGLSLREKQASGTASHYAFGLIGGAVYGLTAELIPNVTAAAGLPFGAFIWAFADEGIVPALGLSKSAEDYPLAIHAHGLASHLIFGLTAELVRRAVRNAL